MTSSVAEPGPSTVIIDARRPRATVAAQLEALWSRRQLVWVLAARDLKVRYKQARFGTLWLFLQPLLLLVLFWGFFGVIMRVPSEGLPYVVFAYAGLVPWNQFAQSITNSATSLLSGHSMLTKVYFPRLALPLSSALAGLPDFLVGTGLLIGLAAAHGFGLTPRLLLIPALYFLTLAFGLSLGLLAAALNVRFRDVGIILPFVLQFMLFSTPVAYADELVPPRLLPLFRANPLCLVVEGFRWAVTGVPVGYSLAAAFAVVATTLIVGFASLWLFARGENDVADRV